MEITLKLVTPSWHSMWMLQVGIIYNPFIQSLENCILPMYNISTSLKYKHFT